MRKLTALLTVVLVLMLGFGGWFYLGGTLRGEVAIQSAPAADYPEAFGAVRSILEGGTAPQVLDGGSLSEDPSPYRLMDINVTLSNRGLFPAEWLHISMEGAPGDIAVYAVTGEGSDVAARDSVTVNLKLVTTAAPDAPLLAEGGNLLAETKLRRGDVEQAFAQAAWTVSNVYHLPATDHGFLEPETAVAWRQGERLTVYCGDQDVYQTRRECSEMLGLPPEQIRVQGQTVGGAFGGKEDMSV